MADALKSCKQLLAVAIATNNKTEQKIAHYNMALTYKTMKDYRQVIKCYEEWLLIASAAEDNLEKGNVYLNLGNAYLELDNTHEAIKCYEKSLEIAQEQQDLKLKLTNYEKLGRSYCMVGQFQKSSDSFEKQLELAVILNDKTIVGSAHRNLALLYEHIGKHAKAIEHNQQYLSISLAMGDRNGVALAYGDLGSAYQSQGKYQKAIEHHERQLQIFIDIGFKRGQARAYGNIGVVYQSLGNYYEALQYEMKNLEMCIEIGDKVGEGRAHGNLGVTYEFLGQYPEAITHSTKCLEYARQFRDRACEGRANINLGTCHLRTDKFKETMEYFQESLRIAKEENDKQGEGAACGYIGKCNTVLGQYKEALVFFEKQIRLAEERGDKNQEAHGYDGKGNLYIELRDYQEAILCFEKQVEIAKERKNKRNEAISYLKLGNAYVLATSLNEKNSKEEQECIAKSIHLLREGLDLCEWLFDHLQEQDHLKISILETFTQYYKLLTVTLLNNSKNKEALLASERGRGRALDDLLVSKYKINLESQSDKNPICYSDIENMASNFSILFYSVLPTMQCTWIICPDSPSTLVQGCEQGGFHDSVKSAYDRLKVREVQCEDRTIEIDEHYEHQKLSVPHQSVVMDDVSQKMLLSACEMLKKRDILREDLDDDDSPSTLQGLYKSLISPVLDNLPKDEIVIIPDGALFMVPYAALRDPNTGEFLSQTKRIRIAPSLTSLKALQESPADFHSKTGALIIGNPKVGKVMFRGQTRVISDLPCAEREAEMIGKLLCTKPFIGSQATKEVIKQNLREGVAIIHFAAHGTTDGEIFLTPSTTDDLPSEQDYILTMKDVQESGVRPQLVVLSCCHSGRGEIKAEGVVGMSRAFLAAGARAVVASLWAIADEATMVFMETFYTHLKQGESASRSLQQAMKDMRDTPRYNDPQFWAPFFLIGDDVTITMWDK